MPTQAFVYVLHFEEKLHHAEHYVGCTESLQGRMIAHAKGAGSNLCRVLREKGIEWKIGSLGLCNHSQMRRLERKLKNIHNVKRYCSFCTPEFKSIPGTRCYPLEFLPFPTQSKLLRYPTPEEVIAVRSSSNKEPLSVLDFIKSTMHADKDALGFIPSGGIEGMNIAFDRGHISLISLNGKDVGYASFSISPDESRVKIWQCVVEDKHRLKGLGRKLIDHVSSLMPEAKTSCTVRDDLAANHFWTSIGFNHVGSRNHKTSKSLLHDYDKPPIGVLSNGELRDSEQQNVSDQ